MNLVLTLYQEDTEKYSGVFSYLNLMVWYSATEYSSDMLEQILRQQ